MEVTRKRRNQYNRNWICAKRATRCSHLEDQYRLSDTDGCSESGMPGLCQEDLPVYGAIAVHRQTDMDGDVSVGDEQNADSDCDSKETVGDVVGTDNILCSDSDKEQEPRMISEDLVTWINGHAIKHNAVDDLLKLLKTHGHDSLPSSARTLLKTDRYVSTKDNSGMKYTYLGLKETILKNMDSYPAVARNHTDRIEISLNIDGLPLFHSSKTCLWPVLCAILIEPVKIFPVAITCGSSKPTNLDFLQDTITDLHDILQNGVQYHGSIVEIVLKYIVCDAPARAMVKATKQYSGYSGCDRCTQRGVYCHNRLTYQDIDNLVMRTDRSFRSQECEEHHHGISPFTLLNVDLVQKFPIDYMHQTCLGVMRRLIRIWIHGKKETKLSAGQIGEISQKLLELRRFIPTTFARKPRGLDDIERWKATEYRQFLLYTGKVVLKGILKPNLYQHFMALSTAMCILVSPPLVQLYKDYAHNLLVYFVRRGRELYGREFLVYNVHTLLHISDDAEQFGSLDKCSGFQFENYLQCMKKMVRSGKNPLSQVVKRIHELEDNTASTLCRRKIGGNIQVQRPNNAFLLENSCCCEAVAVTNEKDDDGSNRILCRVFSTTAAAFMEPCDSRIIGMYRVNTDNGRMKIISQTCLYKKAILMERSDGRYAIFHAILHDL